MQRAAAAAHPREACGLLFGEAGAISGWLEAENVAAEPERHFEIDPRTLLAALKAERAGGPKIAGYWHSHPSGVSEPSPTDADMAAPDGKLWVIVASEVSGWLAGETGRYGRFEPVALTIDDAARRARPPDAGS
jgi:proteasome lid subunit RPN8/RPN11